MLQIKQVELPKPGKKDVLVKVFASAVNPVDWKLRNGWIESWANTGGPFIPGWDVAGVVTQVGDGVKGFKEGDEVYAYHRPEFELNPEDKIGLNGTAAEFVAVPAHRVALKPKSLSFVKAAAFPLAGLTAYQGIFDHGKAKAGQTLLVTGASGGVGQFAVQLAHLKGLKVAGTCSSKNVQYVKGLGCQTVFDYTSPDMDAAVKKAFPEGFDLVFDCVGGASGEQALGWLKKGHTCVSIAHYELAEIAEAQGKKALNFLVKPHAAQLTEVAALFDAGKLSPGSTTTYPLDKIQDAHKASESNRTTGKIVLTVQPEMMKACVYDKYGGAEVGDILFPLVLLSAYYSY